MSGVQEGGSSTLRGLIGDVAGGVRIGDTGNKSWVLEYQGKSFEVHRIVWEVCNGPIPEGMQIDHINGNSLDNKIENLRCVTGKINVRNKGKYRSNTSSVCGVSLANTKVSGKIYQRWIAQWRDLEGRTKSRSFSVNNYGEQEAFNLACQHRDKMIAELNNQGAGYSDRHGT